MITMITRPVKRPIVQVFTIPSSRLAAAWVPQTPLHRRVLEEVLAPTLTLYAQFLLGSRGIPDPDHDDILFRSVEGLRRWLVEDSHVQIRPGQIISPVMVAYAFAHHLTSAEAQALARYCNGEKPIRHQQETLLSA
jgi:hypothetical protein